MVPEFRAPGTTLPDAIVQRLPVALHLSDARLDATAHHLPELNRDLGKRPPPLFELGGRMPRIQRVERSAHVDGNAHERKAPLVRPAQVVATASIGWRPGGNPTIQDGRGAT